MAPPRADKKKFSKEKSKKKTDKTDSKSSLPSTTIAVAITAFIAISVAIYYKNGFNMERKLDEAQRTSTRDTSRTSNNKKTEINTDFKILPRLDGVKVGHIQKRQLSPGKMYEIKTLSLKPLIFEIPNFLSDEDCQTVVDLASKEGLDTSEVQDPETGINIEPTNEETFNNWDYNHDGVIDKVEVMHNLVDLSDLYFSEEDIEKMFEELKVDKNTNGVMDLKEFLTVRTEKIMRYLHNVAKTLPRVKSRNSRQTWLDHRKIKGLNDRVAALTKLPRAVIEESEELQVVHYDPEGHYHCHHDSQDVDPRIPCCVFRDRRRCRLCRYITVLYFLNDVEEGGETAFPVANNATFSIEAWAQITKYRCDLSKHCHKANLFVKPRKGTAIMWYNHLRDDKTGWHGRLDQMTYHGGCDILKGEKWIANNWINILGDSRETMVSYKNPKKKI
ncbi:unnamed protein product [Porites evermanni]|uniref:Fe2OG dioxygenase domain-containing protein n=1 Tax=Porites evermanni TaxID=104178 RepID=A0ABN8QD63_9CNID|nr:unnamed protein product [Porites evermanni]